MAKKIKTRKKSAKTGAGPKAQKPSTTPPQQDCDDRRFGEIFLDKDGRWFHCGVEITHERTIELFSRSVFKDPSGGYRLQVGKEWAKIRVEDAPYLVRAVEFKGKEIQLTLNDRAEEALDPATLKVGKGHVLYCEVKSGQFPARFTRPAYYQLMTCLGEDAQGFFLEYGGSRRYFARNPNAAE
jgi:uncharacterized protein